MAREFIVPGEIISGSGALDMAEGALKLLGKKALIVTDKVMIDLGNCAKVEKALTNQGIAYSIYSDICGEPTDTMIEKGLQIYKDANCDFLVALGGGSPIDSMKAIGSLVVNGGSISDYMGKVIDVKMPPMGHFGAVEKEIGRACVALASPDFKYMSGETITLEGAMGQRP